MESSNKAGDEEQRMTESKAKAWLILCWRNRNISARCELQNHSEFEASAGYHLSILLFIGNKSLDPASAVGIGVYLTKALRNC